MVDGLAVSDAISLISESSMSNSSMSVREEIDDIHRVNKMYIGESLSEQPGS